MSKIRKWSLLSSIPLALSCGAAWAGAEECHPGVTAAAGRHFKLAGLKTSGDALVDENCRPFPRDAATTIAAYVVGREGQRKALLLALVDTARDAVTASYRAPMPEEDAVTRIQRGSVIVDPTSFPLSEKAKVLGLFFDTTWMPCAAQGGWDHELQLFVAEGRRLRPLFDVPVPTHYYRRETTDCFNPGKTFSMRVTIQILASTTYGFSDLQLTATETEDDDPSAAATRSLSAVAKFDGRRYDLSSWRREVQR